LQQLKIEGVNLRGSENRALIHRSESSVDEEFPRVIFSVNFTSSGVDHRVFLLDGRKDPFHLPNHFC